MRLVNREEFLKQPTGTVFMKYSPMMFQTGLRVFQGAFGDNDFLYDSLDDCAENSGSDELYDKILPTLEEFESIKLDFHYTCRDGFFDDPSKVRFAIFEKQDVLALIERLKECIQPS